MRLLRPIAQFIKTCIDKAANKWLLMAKAEVVIKAEFGNFWPQSPSSYKSSDDDDYRTRSRSLQKAQVQKVKDFRAKVKVR